MLNTAASNIGPSNSIRFIVGSLFFVLTFVTGACKSDYQSSARQNPPGDSKSARQVKTARVEETPFGETVIANGTLAAFDQSTAGVKVAGRLRSISVDLGSVVRRGQMIAQIEPADYVKSLSGWEGRLAPAKVSRSN
jgi:multidrug efflux pump subunit AcrA (membrane-fusion protein)